MTNTINVVGTVATIPKLMRTQNGISMCTFRLASGERRYDREKQEWVDGETNWYSVTVFRALAEHVQQSISRGERILLSGRLRVRRWEKEERSGTNVEIEVDAIGHDLRWGISSFKRAHNNGAASFPIEGERGQGLVADLEPKPDGEPLDSSGEPVIDPTFETGSASEAVLNEEEEYITAAA